MTYNISKHLLRRRPSSSVSEKCDYFVLKTFPGFSANIFMSCFIFDTSSFVIIALNVKFHMDACV